MDSVLLLDYGRAKTATTSVACGALQRVERPKLRRVKTPQSKETIDCLARCALVMTTTDSSLNSNETASAVFVLGWRKRQDLCVHFRGC